jgi:hypothetical protein
VEGAAGTLINLVARQADRVRATVRSWWTITARLAEAAGLRKAS